MKTSYLFHLHFIFRYVFSVRAISISYHETKSELHNFSFSLSAWQLIKFIFLEKTFLAGELHFQLIDEKNFDNLALLLFHANLPMIPDYFWAYTT